MASCGDDWRVSIASAARSFLWLRLAAPLGDLDGIVFSAGGCRAARKELWLSFSWALRECVVSTERRE